MANVRKRISELTALNSASLDTVIVGVDNGTTYKIELDVLADAVTSRVNTLDRERLQSLESVTSSFETKGRSVVSGSSQLTSSYDTRYTLSGSVQPLPSNLVSSSAQITAFGFISSSQTIDNGSLLTTSSFNSYTASISTASLVTSISNLNTTTSSLNISVNALNTATSSYETKGRSIVSGSSQLTSSFDTRYAISASFVSSSNLSSIQTITSASYAALTPVSGTLYIIIG
jgi:hypothetical protein